MTKVKNRSLHTARDSCATVFHLDVARFSQKNLSLRYWKERFNELVASGRFIACDKNLGVRFITNDYYNKLAVVEARNYEHVYEDVHPEVLLKILQSNLLTIASVIGVQATVKSNCKDFSVSHLYDKEVRVLLTQLAAFIKSTGSGAVEKYSLPRLRMTLKIHKPNKNGLIPTRPIIPTCGLPNFAVAQWLGSFLARMARLIPWNLECSSHFQQWLTDPSRGSRIASFDFSNLYGTEPVKETLLLFASAIEEMNWNFEDHDDNVIFAGLRTIVIVPEQLGLNELIGHKSSILLLLLADMIRCTIAELDVNGEMRIVCTAKFLAMGCPPVAPISIISLAYLETKIIGFDKCRIGMKRYIDDVIIDTEIISEELLRSAYPAYLTLNNADEDHYLDVSFVWANDKFVTWPYVKEHATIPLNFQSFHPPHTIRAAAKNELVRLMQRTTLYSAKPAWVGYWYTRYFHAGYPECILRNILKEVICGAKVLKQKNERGTNHIEIWRGGKTGTSQSFAEIFQQSVSTAWSVNRSLLSYALKAHLDVKKLTQESKETCKEKNSDDFPSLFPFLFQKKKVFPEDANSEKGSGRKASDSKKERRKQIQWW